MMLEEIGTFSFHPSQREKFKTGELKLSWSEQYPQLFDSEDIRITNHQNTAHFFEWLGAILIFNSMGYLSLIEKYEFKVHKRKQDVLRRLVSPDILDIIHKRGTQCPDLLAYAMDMSDWFFCEVKGPGDRLRSEQKKYFEELSKASGKPIRIMRFRAVKS